MSVQNPKLEGSNLIDCIPQTGECPNKCSECFYNGGRFFRTLDEPMLPEVDETMGKIVRVNSGHNSNIDKGRVILSTCNYDHRFYNTSIPRFDFPDPKTGLQMPVVFTANRQCPENKVYLVENPPKNLMFVRARVTGWDLMDPQIIVTHYWYQYKIPVVLTFMRFYDGNLIPKKYRNYYEWKEHIINDYWVLKQERLLEILKVFKGQGVRMCGTPVSSLCKDCRNCEFLYWDCLRRMGR